MCFVCAVCCAGWRWAVSHDNYLFISSACLQSAHVATWTLHWTSPCLTYLTWLRTSSFFYVICHLWYLLFVLSNSWLNLCKNIKSFSNSPSVLLQQVISTTLSVHCCCHYCPYKLSLIIILNSSRATNLDASVIGPPQIPSAYYCVSSKSFVFYG